MANQRDKQNLQPDNNADTGGLKVETAEIKTLQLGPQSGPPRPLAGKGIPKQWQPPKNESTPNNRAKKE